MVAGIVPIVILTKSMSVFPIAAPAKTGAVIKTHITT